MIHNIFQTLITAWAAVNSWEIPAGEWFRTIKGMTLSGYPYLLKNGLRDVIDALGKVILDNQGEIFTRTGARRIFIEDEVVRGVTAEHEGEEFEIEATIVISNVGPKRTIELGGEANFDRGYLKEVRERIRPGTGVDYYLISDKPLMHFPSVLFTTDTRRTECWIPEDNTDGPKGKYILRSATVPESTIVYSPTKEFEIFLQDLKETFPHFEQYGGEILMARNFYGEWPFFRTWPGYSVSQKTSVENLYNVGDAVNPTGFIGGSGAADSARIVVEDIKTRLKPG